MHLLDRSTIFYRFLQPEFSVPFKDQVESWSAGVSTPAGRVAKAHFSALPIAILPGGLSVPSRP